MIEGWIQTEKQNLSLTMRDLEQAKRIHERVLKEIVDIETGAEGTSGFQNGSFEQGQNPGLFAVKSVGSTDIKGWVVTRATIDYIKDAWTSSDNERSLDMDGTPASGGMAQTFGTVPGHRYTVSFDLAGNPDCPPETKKLRVSAAEQESEDFNFKTNQALSWEQREAIKKSNMGWQTKTWNFVAKDSNTTLEFYSLDPENGNCGPALDNVKVQ